MPPKTQAKGKDHPPAGAPQWKSIRPAKVARARKLLADPNYPTKKVMQAVAGLLARKLAAKRPRRKT